MGEKIRKLVQRQWAGLIALFLVLSGGTALATHPGGANTISSLDIINGEVRSADIGSGNVQNSDLGGSAVTGGKIAPGTVQGSDVQNDDLTGTDVLNNSLTGDDVQESSLDLGGFFAAESTATSSCFDVDGNGEICASKAVTLDRPGKLLLNATGDWIVSAYDDADGTNAGDDADFEAVGLCVLLVDGSAFSGSQFMGERQTAPGATPNHTGEAAGTLALTGLSVTFPAGAHTVAVDCTEVDGAMVWHNINLTAAAVGQ